MNELKDETTEGDVIELAKKLSKMIADRESEKMTGQCAVKVMSAKELLDELFNWASSEYDIAKRQCEVSRQLRNYQQAARHDSYAKAMSKVLAKLACEIH